ncbi:unnamed protein product [Sphagnum jensenii]|uniref:Uncharacterized protein n=1 Tax=Sphagnum jensenii TaxID=128206 RepID=A0ABP0VJ73_9BRYO
MVRGLLLLLSLLMLWAVLLVLLAGTMEVTTVALQNFTLGFLLPSRSSEMTSLVTEWETAFCVAVEVLNSGKQTYHLLPYSKLSGFNSIWDFFMYGAGAQAEAVPASIVKLHMSNVTIIYTMGHYALNLANNINNKRLEFPWWYFGTDRVTAFDPADEFETAIMDVASGDLWFILCSERWCMMMDVTDPTLVCALVAEIGLSPYSGDYTQNYISKKFHSYWRTTNYSGLPAVGQNKSCTYTPYLIDTVTAYFEVCDALWNHSLSITAENILKALNRSGPLETHPWFQGRTGLVAMDSTTGSQEC